MRPPEHTHALKTMQRMRDMWLQEGTKDEPNLDVKFQYALTLIKTRSHDRNREGMSLLEGERWVGAPAAPRATRWRAI